MQLVEQGDLLNVDGLSHPVIVVSNNFFNQSGKAVVCPILRRAAAGPLHIRLKDTPVEGYDLAARHFSKLTATHYFDIMDISDAVMSIFDYQNI